MSKALDKAIKVVDAGSEADFTKAIQLLDQVENIVGKYGRKIDSSSMFNMIGSLKKKFEFYKKNAAKGWYD